MRSGRAPYTAFIDTHALLAAINSDDAHHNAAVKQFSQLAAEKCAVAVSDWVLAEFLSAAARPPLRVPATKAVDMLLASKLTTVFPATRDTWTAAFKLFRTRPDKAWSLVDCTTIALCHAHGIPTVLTHDHHFVQAGLDILIP